MIASFLVLLFAIFLIVFADELSEFPWPDRQYAGHEGRPFAVWFWKDILRPGNDGPYIRRLYLFWTPWGGAMLHWFQTSDPNEALHDHPWAFASLVLRGSYVEDRMRVVCPGEGPDHVVAKVERRLVRWINVKVGARATHAVSWIEPGTITLVFTGPRTRRWGFWKQVPKPAPLAFAEEDDPLWMPCVFKWTYWRDYLGQ